MKTTLIVLVGILAVAAIAQPEAFANLLANPGFEEPVQNNLSSPPEREAYSTAKINLSVTEAEHQGGVRCLQLSAQGVPHAAQGLIQHLDVVSGEKYTFSASVINDADAPLKGTTYLQLCIEWLDADGREVSRVFTRPQGQAFSKSRWTILEVEKVRAPPKAIRAVVGLHLYEGERGGKGSLLVDDVLFGLVP